MYSCDDREMYFQRGLPRRTLPVARKESRCDGLYDIAADVIPAYKRGFEQVQRCGGGMGLRLRRQYARRLCHLGR